MQANFEWFVRAHHIIGMHFGVCRQMPCVGFMLQSRLPGCNPGSEASHRYISFVSVCVFVCVCVCVCVCVHACVRVCVHMHLAVSVVLWAQIMFIVTHCKCTKMWSMCDCAISTASCETTAHVTACRELLN